MKGRKEDSFIMLSIWIQLNVLAFILLAVVMLIKCAVVCISKLLEKRMIVHACKNNPAQTRIEKWKAYRELIKSSGK